MFSYSILFLIMIVSFLSVKEFKIHKNENFYGFIIMWVDILAVLFCVI